MVVASNDLYQADPVANDVDELFCGCSYGGGPPRFGGSRGGGGGGGKYGNPGERLRKKHWNLDELPKFEKNFYQQHPDVTRRPPVCTHMGPLSSVHLV